MASIILRPKYPRDLKPAELETLAQEIRSALGDAEADLQVRVESGDDDHRVTTTFTEIVNLVLEGVGCLGGVGTITEIVGSWMRRRKDEKGDHRPRTTNILGPDGKVIRIVEIDDRSDKVRVKDIGKK